MPIILANHNAVNERAWELVMKYEKFNYNENS